MSVQRAEAVLASPLARARELFLRHRKQLVEEVAVTDPQRADEIKEADERVAREIHQPDPMGGG